MDGTEASAQAMKPEGGKLDLQTFTAAIRRRWKLMVAVALLVTAAVIGVSLLLTPVWTASAQIQIEPNRRSPVDFEAAIQGGAPDQAIVDTEVALMQSREVLRRVVTDLALTGDPEFVKPKDGERAPDPQAAAETAVNVLADKLSIEREGTTYLVTVSASSEDRVKAAKIANAIAERYIEASVETRSSTATTQSATLRKQLDQLGGEVQAAEARVAQYRSQAGIVEGGASGTITDQQVGPLAGQLATAEAQAAATQATLASARSQIARGGIEGVSGVLNSPVIADLRRQRAEILQREGAIERYLEKHPERQAFAQQRRDIDAQIAEESRRIIAGLESEARAAGASAARLRTELSRLRSQQAANSGASVTADSLERQAEARRTVYNQLAQAAQQTAQQRQGAAALGRIVDFAEPPLQPSFPNRPLFAMLGLFLGIIAAGAVVAGAESFDLTVRSVADVDTLGVPYLSSVPRLSRRHLAKSSSAWDYVLEKPMSGFAESLRTLRSAALLSSRDQSQVLAMCSALPGEGKTTVAVSLARTMATSGDSVVVVDCDLRRGRLASIAGTVPQVGLVEILLGEATLEQALLVDERTGLAILPLAKRDFMSRDLFGGPEMQQLLAQLRKQYRFVILDTPPLLAVADARALAVMADSAVVMIGWGKTSRFAVQASLSRLRKDKAHILGAALTMVERGGGSTDPSDPSYYANSYAGYYQD